MSGTTLPPRFARHLPLHRGGSGGAPPVVRMNFHTAGAYGMPPYGVRFSPNRAKSCPKGPLREGAGATAPEGLFGLDFLPNKREGKPLPYGI